MLRTWLSYILVTLIALQSVLAIADTHESHQQGTGHIELDERTLLKISDLSADAQLDCNHCCHCHNYAQVLISPNHTLKTAFSFVQLAQYNRVNYLSNLSSPDIRPPIT